MRKKIYFLSTLLGCLVFSQLMAQEAPKDTILMFFLGGQSNMVGYGKNSELPKDLNRKIKDVYIFHGNSAPDGALNGGIGKWETLRPGHGTGFSSDGTTNTPSECFGIELSLAQQLKTYYPGKKIALIKYARGGSSIDSLAANVFGCWDPHFQEKNQYTHFLNTLNHAMQVSDINGDGIKDYLKPMGILWMQGESDGDKTEEIALRYYHNLSQLLTLIRASLWSKDLPIVIGKISDSWNDKKDGKVWDYGELVQYAQEKFVRNDKHAAIIRSTRYYKHSDPWHYTSTDYVDFGKQFAKEIYQLQAKTE